MTPEAPAVQGGPNPDVLWRVVGAEALLLDSTSGNYFSLNPVATAIWLRLTAGESAEQAAAGIAGTYSIDADNALQDIEAFLTEMRDANIWR